MDRVFRLPTFRDAMEVRGFILYPGKLTALDSLRVGTIGCFNTGVIGQAVVALAAAPAGMGVAGLPALLESLA